MGSVLDRCENHSFEALPDAFCEDFLTFRGKLPHVTGTGDHEDEEEDEEEDEFTGEEEEEGDSTAGEFTDEEVSEEEEDEFTAEEEEEEDGREDFEDEEDDEFALDDGDIPEDLRKIQPEKLQTQRLVSPEKVTGIATLPRGACSGILLPDAGKLCETVNEEHKRRRPQKGERQKGKRPKGERARARKWRRSGRELRCVLKL